MEVRLLGPVEVVKGDQVVRITASKQRAVLSLLALQAGRVVPLDTIVDRLWDRPPASAAHAVGVYVSALRRLLPSAELLRRRQPGYWLDLPSAAVDALRFERLMRDAQTSLQDGQLSQAVSELREALGLWSGPALVDAREGSLRVEAERLDESRLAAYEACLDAELRLGRVDTVLADAERLLAEHPLRPQLVRAVMLARHGAGRQADALAAYRDHRLRLDAELGLAPDPILRELETAILRDDVKVPRPARQRRRTYLPVQPTPFVGRQRELDEVTDLLFSQGTRLLTLTGPGGVGKTRLALQVAGSAVDRLADGVFFVSLSTVREPALVVSAVAETLGIREQAGQTLAATLAAYLADQETLLLLDNFEQVSSAAGDVATLLAAAPRLRVLVTSRTVLRLRGEQIYDLPPLGVPAPSDSLEAILQADAVRLLLGRAQAVDPEFTIDESNGAAVAELCRRLDGLALAVELAAARIRVLPPKAMLGRLDRRLHLLSNGSPDSEIRQQTLEATIEWSHGLLRLPERDLFERLSIFVGGFRLEAAGSLVAAGPRLEIDVFDGVATLLANSLLRRWVDPDGEPRFWMLETIREFALAQLELNGSLSNWQRLHANYFADLAEAAEGELWGVEQAAWATRLDSDHDNFRAAVAWTLAAGEAELALRLAGALEPYWETRGHIAEGRRWLADALAADTPAAPARRAKALFGASRLAAIEGDYGQERPLLEEAVDLFRQASDQRGLPFALAHLGVVLGRLGEPVASAKASQHSVGLARELADPWLLAMALNCQATALLDDKQYAAAQPAIEESLAIRRRLGEKRGIAVTLDSLGSLRLAQGRGAEALAPLEEALALVRELGNVMLEATVLTSLGFAALNVTDYERARTLLRQSLVISHEIADRETMSSALIGLVALELERDEDRACELWNVAAALRDRLGSPPLAHVLPIYESILLRLPASAAGQELDNPRVVDNAITGILAKLEV